MNRLKTINSVNLVTDYRGEIIEHVEYTPYGELWIETHDSSRTAETVPYRFTGKELDGETGLYYYGARYLDPRTSRWLSTDPAMGEYVPGLGQYRYDLF
jgi:RHS repeat-associated protein